RHSTAHRRHDGIRQHARANEQGRWHPERRLGRCEVHAGPWRLQLSVSRVGHDTHDGEVVFGDTQLPANWISTRPEVTGHGGADDDHRLRTLIVFVGDGSPAEYGNPKHREVVRRSDVHVHNRILRLLFFTLPRCGHTSIDPATLADEWNGEDGRDVPHTGEGLRIRDRHVDRPLLSLLV